MKVLIVDDSELNAHSLERALRNRFSVRTANTVEQALSALQQDVPDVLVCDFELGDEYCTDFMRVVTRDYPTVRRILHSGSQPELWVELVTDRLIDVAVSKPATLSSLVAAFYPTP